MKTSVKRKYIGAAGIVIGIIVTGVFLFHRISIVNAKDTLPGVEKIVSEIKANQDTFRILEIVSDSRSGEIGYYVKGQEPVKWEEELRKLKFIEERKNFMERLSIEMNYGSVVYTSYEEKTSLSGEEIASSLWTEFEFETPVLETGLKGSYVLNSENTGNYRKKVTPVEGVGFIYSPGGGEDYEANAAYYYLDETSDSSGRNYLLQFTYAGSETGKEGYIPTAASVRNSETLNLLPDTTGIYVINGDGKYQYKSTGAVLKAELLAEPTLDLSAYYTVTFAYTKNTTGDYYSPSHIDFTLAGQGEYKAMLDAYEPYVNSAGEGHFRLDNPSNLPTPLVTTYELMEGMGNYDWVGDDTSSASYDVTLPRIYYKGGFENQDWFKEYVFDLEKEEYDSFPITVTTLTAVEANNYEIREFDFIYISGNKNHLGETVPGYSMENDLTWQKVSEIFHMAASEKISCVADASIITDASLNGTNIYKLAGMLAQEDIENFYETYFTGEGGIEYARTAINWADISNGYFSDPNSDWNFVNKNVYFFNRNHTKLIDPSFITIFTEEEINNGFEAVLLELESENFYRETDTSDNYAPLPTDVNKAVVVKYIVNYSNRRNIINKSNVRVLEIQPTNSYELTPAVIREWAPDLNLTDENIQILQMTTAEFVGKIEDLNGKYDLIYIGTKPGLLNQKSNGTTDFNDNNMDGLVYFHVGDKVVMNSSLSGMLDTEYVNNDNTKYLYDPSYYARNETVTMRIRDPRTNSLTGNTSVTLYEPNVSRYSGNDITKWKLNDLIEYANANYPIVLADDFYKTGQNNELEVNGDKIDNSSYLYEFADEMLKNKDNRKNVFRKSLISSSLFSYYLNRPKLQVTLTTPLIDSDNDGISELNPVNGSYYLEYDFMISNVGAISRDANYNCKLYIDINADGKHSAMEEISDIIITSNGNPVSKINGEYQLKADTPYHLLRQVPDGYKEVLPWKIEVFQENNSYIRNHIGGYSKIISSSVEKIRILQIDSASGSTLNLKYQIETNGTIFNKLVKEIDDEFNIQIDRITTSEFPGKWRDNKNYLDDYNMLVLGFADCYSDIDNTIGAVGGKGCINGEGGILEFIEKGKSVLFTHDTTSFVNMTANQKYTQNSGGTTTSVGGFTYWGYNINTYIRSAVGMDKYGVTSPKTNLLKKGLPIQSGTSNWTTLLSLEKDIAYTPKDDRSSSVAQVHGYTYHTLNSRRTTGTNARGMTLLNLNVGALNNTGNGAYTSPTVAKINDGQITNYPFKLPDQFQVSSTHQQYYTLDLEADDDKDGESDIVVWYTLNDGDGNPNNGDDIYTASPNDVSNNYYIYNKGNITYSGVGHSTITGETEAKLFINTMVAAYNAGMKAPEITIRDGSSSNAGDLENIHIAYDDTLENEILDTRETLYFHVSDVNFIRGEKKIVANYYYEDKNGTETITINGSEIKVFPLNSEDTVTKNARMGEVVDKDSLTSEEVYEITISTAYLKPELNSVTIYIEVQSQLDSYGAIKTTDKAYDTVTLVRTHFFNLK